MLLSVAIPSAALAQTRDSLDSLRSAVTAIRPGSVVRVELQGRRRIAGTLGAVSADAFQLHDSGGAASVALGDVTRLWRRGRASGTGAVVGGALIGVAGAVFGAALAEWSGSPRSKGAVAGGVAGFGLGAAAGAIVGLALPKWHRAWPDGTQPGAHRAEAPPAPVGTGADAPLRLREVAPFTGIVGLGQTRGRWRFEARWHPVLQYDDPYRSDPTYLTVGFGRVVSWQ